SEPPMLTDAARAANFCSTGIIRYIDGLRGLHSISYVASLSQRLSSSAAVTGEEFGGIERRISQALTYFNRAETDPSVVLYFVQQALFSDIKEVGVSFEADRHLFARAVEAVKVWPVGKTSQTRQTRGPRGQAGPTQITLRPNSELERLVLPVVHRYLNQRFDASSTSHGIGRA
ncbi:hypothetical protein KIPB_011665, partial [Kipferlia bialata]